MNIHWQYRCVIPQYWVIVGATWTLSEVWWEQEHGCQLSFCMMQHDETQTFLCGRIYPLTTGRN